MRPTRGAATESPNISRIPFAATAQHEVIGSCYCRHICGNGSNHVAPSSRTDFYVGQGELPRSQRIRRQPTRYGETEDWIAAI
ncbi:hypothetical protein R1flu_017520 [Riccia fluitans]|uniref:Uncharacterized protein n=1 Tax=Riccia fluitans TaxID=41844 RepID=A0ABD1ZDE3_9MARC